MTSNEMESHIIKCFVGNDMSLLEPYRDNGQSGYFMWILGLAIEPLAIKFKPRIISFNVINDWLAMQGIKDIAILIEPPQRVYPTTGSLPNPHPELCIFFKTVESSLVKSQLSDPLSK